jgi:hypothetical protein
LFGVGYQIAAVVEFELKRLLGEAASLGVTAQGLRVDLTADLESLLAAGASSSSAAVGTYSWDGVGIIDPAVGTGISNRQCRDVMSTVETAEGQKAFQLSLASNMALALAVPAGAIEFPVDVACGPVDALQTRDDQAAAFSISNMRIRAVYQLFAANASYVDFSKANVNPALQGTEQTAALSIEAVTYAMQQGLALSFLLAIKSYYGLWRL